MGISLPRLSNSQFPSCQDTGKSTVSNSLCGALCTPAGYGRTTEGINIFRLYTKAQVKDGVAEDRDATDEQPADDGSDRKRPASNMEGLSNAKRYRYAECVHEEIKEKNRRHQGLGGGPTVYDVLVKELPITMRDDCRLVLVEAPGLNTSSEESRAYFADNWDEFDAVIVVVDAQEKADHRDQIENLVLIRSHLEKKDIPCFILCNKVRLPRCVSVLKLVAPF